MCLQVAKPSPMFSGNRTGIGLIKAIQGNPLGVRELSGDLKGRLPWDVGPLVLPSMGHTPCCCNLSVYHLVILLMLQLANTQTSNHGNLLAPCDKPGPGRPEVWITKPGLESKSSDIVLFKFRLPQLGQLCNPSVTQT